MPETATGRWRTTTSPRRMPDPDAAKISSPGSIVFAIDIVGVLYGLMVTIGITMLVTSRTAASPNITQKTILPVCRFGGSVGGTRVA